MQGSRLNLRISTDHMQTQKATDLTRTSDVTNTTWKLWLMRKFFCIICIYDQDMRSDWAYLLFWDFRIAVKSKIKLSFITVALVLWKNNHVLSRLILSFESLKVVIFAHILSCCDDRKPVTHTKNKEWHWDGPLNGTANFCSANSRDCLVLITNLCFVHTIIWTVFAEYPRSIKDSLAIDYLSLREVI